MENRKDRTALIAIVTGLITLLLGVCLGALVGGFGGYFLGREIARGAAAPELSRLLLPTPEPTATPGAPALPEREWPWFRMPVIPPQSGALVREVIKGSPAEDAGLQVGDLITQVDETALDETHRLADLIGEYRPGDRVTLTVWRFGETHTIKVKLGKNPDDPDRAYLGIKYTDFWAKQRLPEPRQ